MKVLEIITIAKWVDGSGYQYEETYSSKVINIAEKNAEELKKNFNWKFWEKQELAEGEDIEITVKYYNPDYDPMFDDDEPFAEFKTWESEIVY